LGDEGEILVCAIQPVIVGSADRAHSTTSRAPEELRNEHMPGDGLKRHTPFWRRDGTFIDELGRQTPSEQFISRYHGATVSPSSASAIAFAIIGVTSSIHAHCPFGFISKNTHSSVGVTTKSKAPNRRPRMEISLTTALLT
jgi:hypothetical protein